MHILFVNACRHAAQLVAVMTRATWWWNRLEYMIVHIIVIPLSLGGSPLMCMCIYELSRALMAVTGIVCGCSMFVISVRMPGFTVSKW